MAGGGDSGARTLAMSKLGALKQGVVLHDDDEARPIDMTGGWSDKRFVSAEAAGPMVRARGAETTAPTNISRQRY